MERTKRAAARIRVNAAGNYLVRGVPLYDDSGEPIDAPEIYTLCRCGQSQNKPFCDDSHLSAGFAPDEGSARSSPSLRRVTYRGEGITVYDDRAICSRAAKCRLGSVFRPGTSPWVNPDEAPPEDVARVVLSCPSGALSYSFEPDGDPEGEVEGPSITVTRNGPYAVRGVVEMRTGDGSTCELRDRNVLCRCGASKEMPYCDGSHIDTGFTAD